MDHRKLRTVRQLASPALSEAAIRAYIADAANNGLAPAIVRNGRRIFLDVNRFNAWLEYRTASRGA